MDFKPDSMNHLQKVISLGEGFIYADRLSYIFRSVHGVYKKEGNSVFLAIVPKDSPIRTELLKGHPDPREGVLALPCVVPSDSEFDNSEWSARIEKEFGFVPEQFATTITLMSSKNKPSSPLLERLKTYETSK